MKARRFLKNAAAFSVTACMVLGCIGAFPSAQMTARAAENDDTILLPIQLIDYRADNLLFEYDWATEPFALTNGDIPGVTVVAAGDNSSIAQGLLEPALTEGQPRYRKEVIDYVASAVYNELLRREDSEAWEATDSKKSTTDFYKRLREQMKMTEGEADGESSTASGHFITESEPVLENGSWSEGSLGDGNPWEVSIDEQPDEEKLKENAVAWEFDGNNIKSPGHVGTLSTIQPIALEPGTYNLEYYLMETTSYKLQIMAGEENLLEATYTDDDGGAKEKAFRVEEKTDEIRIIFTPVAGEAVGLGDYVRIQAAAENTAPDLNPGSVGWENALNQNLWSVGPEDSYALDGGDINFSGRLASGAVTLYPGEYTLTVWAKPAENPFIFKVIRENDEIECEQTVASGNTGNISISFEIKEKIQAEFVFASLSGENNAYLGNNLSLTYSDPNLPEPAALLQDNSWKASVEAKLWEIGEVTEISRDVIDRQLEGIAGWSVAGNDLQNDTILTATVSGVCRVSGGNTYKLESWLTNGILVDVKTTNEEGEENGTTLVHKYSPKGANTFATYFNVPEGCESIKISFTSTPGIGTQTIGDNLTLTKAADGTADGTGHNYLSGGRFNVINEEEDTYEQLFGWTAEGAAYHFLIDDTTGNYILHADGDLTLRQTVTIDQGVYNFQAGGQGSGSVTLKSGNDAVDISGSIGMNRTFLYAASDPAEVTVTICLSEGDALSLAALYKTSNEISYRLGTYEESASKKFADESDITSCYDYAYYMMNNFWNPDNVLGRKAEIFNKLQLNKTADGSYAFYANYDLDRPSSPKVDGELTSVENKTVLYDTETKIISNAEDGAVNQSAYAAEQPGFFPLESLNYDDEWGYTNAKIDPPAGQTVRTYENNYHYALVSKGKFVYQEADNLFFDFTGDDDVYLFIDGKLVLDVGGAHLAATQKINLNELVNSGKLALENNQVYDFEFFYLERCTDFANLRINTNIRVMDPGAVLTMTAYQDGTELPSGSEVQPGSTIEYVLTLRNTGESSITNLHYVDEMLEVDISKDSIRLGSNNGSARDIRDLRVMITENGAATTIYLNQDSDPEKKLKELLSAVYAEGAVISIGGLFYDIPEDAEDGTEIINVSGGEALGDTIVNGKVLLDAGTARHTLKVKRTSDGRVSLSKTAYLGAEELKSGSGVAAGTAVEYSLTLKNSGFSAIGSLHYVDEMLGVDISTEDIVLGTNEGKSRDIKELTLIISSDGDSAAAPAVYKLSEQANPEQFLKEKLKATYEPKAAVTLRGFGYTIAETAAEGDEIRNIFTGTATGEKDGQMQVLDGGQAEHLLKVTMAENSDEPPSDDTTGDTSDDTTGNSSNDTSENTSGDPSEGSSSGSNSGEAQITANAVQSPKPKVQADTAQEEETDAAARNFGGINTGDSTSTWMIALLCFMIAAAAVVIGAVLYCGSKRKKHSRKRR